MDDARLLYIQTCSQGGDMKTCMQTMHSAICVRKHVRSLAEARVIRPRTSGHCVVNKVVRSGAKDG
jgi:hypothetical protein